MPDKKLKHNDKGNFNELKHDTVDESDIINDPTDPRHGLPRFLSWDQFNAGKDDEYWEAKGKDGKIYRVVSDEPPKPPKKGKIEIV